MQEALTVLTVNERPGLPTHVSLILISALALAAIVIVAWSGAWGTSAEANGSVTKYTTLTAGPYDVSLGTAPPDPRTGPLHLTVKLSPIGSEDAITGADVVVSGRGPGAAQAEIGPLPTFSLPATPEDYDPDVEVDREGIWTFTVDVDASLGEATAVFLLDVSNPSPWLGILTLALALVLLMIVGLSMRRYLAARRAQGRPSR